MIRQGIPDAIILKLLYFNPNQSGSVSWFTFLPTRPLTLAPILFPSAPLLVLPQLTLAGRKQGQGRPSSTHLD